MQLLKKVLDEFKQFEATATRPVGLEKLDDEAVVTRVPQNSVTL